MPKARLSSVLLVVAIGLAALGAFSAAPGDEAKVRAFLTAFGESFETARSPEEIAAFYSRDGSHIGLEGKRVSGSAALALHFRPLLSRRVSLEIAHLSFISDRVALVDGLVRMSSAGAGSATTVERFALVTRETSEGFRIVCSRMSAMSAGTEPETARAR